MSPISSEDSAAGMPSTTEVKDLFGMMLDASESPVNDAMSSGVVAAKAAFDAAAPQVRAAVEKLLEAHRRASGVLLEGAPRRAAGDGAGDAAWAGNGAGD